MFIFFPLTHVLAWNWTFAQAGTQSLFLMLSLPIAVNRWYHSASLKKKTMNFSWNLHQNPKGAAAWLHFCAWWNVFDYLILLYVNTIAWMHMCLEWHWDELLLGGGFHKRHKRLTSVCEAHTHTHMHTYTHARAHTNTHTPTHAHFSSHVVQFGCLSSGVDHLLSPVYCLYPQLCSVLLVVFHPHAKAETN